MGNEDALLWPNRSAMAQILCLARPRSQVLTTDNESPELLWPAQLINRQAHLATHRDHSRPVATVTLILSIILAIIIGPAQLILIATMLDYNWVTTTYLGYALQGSLLVASIIALIDFVALLLAWKSSPERTAQTIVLTTGSLALLFTIWLTGCVISLQPHQLTLLLLGLTLLFVMLALLVNKQYFTHARNTFTARIILSILMLFSLVVAGLSFTGLSQAHGQTDPEQIAALTAEMRAAEINGVPSDLSDLTYLLCRGRYSLILLADDQASGLFECDDSGDVYSVQSPTVYSTNSARATATYLGTTSDAAVSQDFPAARYLYRSLPALSENELALMVPATNEVELIDTLTPQLLSYWNAHNEANLFLNVFYNPDLATVTSTRDFVLLAAMDTMVLVNQLPGGNTRYGPADDKMITYFYSIDRNLTTLNQLAADPTLYASSTRTSLTSLRHISLRLNADTYLDYVTLRELLKTSFTEP